MHFVNQSSRKLDKLSHGSSKLDKLSRVQWGNILDKREATDPRGKQSSESREVELRGMLGQGTIKTVDYPCCRKL